MTIAGRYETQEIVFRTEPAPAVNGAAASGVVSAPVPVSSSVTDLLAQVASNGASVNGLVTSQGSASVLLPTDAAVGNNNNFQQPQPPQPVQAPAAAAAPAGAFRSPNVVAPGSQPLPFLQQRPVPVQAANNAFAPTGPNGPGVARAQPVYAGPYPFASMTHAAQSMLGQTGQPSSPNVSHQAIPRTSRPPLTANTTIPGVQCPPAAVAVALPSPSSSSPHLLSSALHPVKSAETAPVVISSAPGTNPPAAAQHFQSHQPQQQPSTSTPSNLPIPRTPLVINQQVVHGAAAPSGVAQPASSTVSSPLLVNLLQQQQQQQQLLARSNSTSSNSGSPILASSLPGTTTSDAIVESNPVEPLEKVRQSGNRVNRNSPLSSSPVASPFHTSSPNSPTAAETTNLTLAASVTVLNVRTGAPLNATALSNLTPTIPPNATPAPQTLAVESGETIQVIH